MGVAHELADQVIALLRVAPAFAGVNAWVPWFAPTIIPQNLFPLAEVPIVSQDEGQHDTKYHEYAYTGGVIFNVQYIDTLVPDPVTKVCAVPSADLCSGLADAARLILMAAQSLGDFVTTDGKERVYRVDVSTPSYVMGPSRTARPDNLENRAALDLVIWTRRQLW